MWATRTSARVALILLLCSGLLTITTTSVSAPEAAAQDPSDFTLFVTNGALPAVGGLTEVLVSLDPGQSTIAAAGATITVDTTKVQAVECLPLVALGVCTVAPDGVVNFQTVDPAGWSTVRDLFSVTYTSLGLDDDVILDVSLTEAYNVGGQLIAGSITNGTIGLDLNGDVDCDNVRTIGDALLIAQFVVGLRTQGSCPLGDPTTQIDLTTADATGDGFLDIGDALQVARCTVGLLDCDE